MSKFTRKIFLLSIASAFLYICTSVNAAPLVENDVPQFTNDEKLIKPDNYRQWVLIGTGLGMVYGPLHATSGGHPSFTNVFVNPSAYRHFLQSGSWPDKTILLLEVRESIALNNSATGGNGYYQGEVIGIEAHVKDEHRFKGGWAFFGLSDSQPTGTHIPETADCYACHATNAAVDTTFVQFYPVLRDIAKQKATFRNVPSVF